jgi:hypothetical protein
VPLSPDFGRCEHTSGSAHVTEGSLSSTVSSSSRNTGNTRNSTTYSSSALPTPISPAQNVRRVYVRTGTPGLSRGLVTSLLAHGIWLTLILGHSSVDSLNNIRSDWRCEDLFRTQSALTLTTFSIKISAVRQNHISNPIPLDAPFISAFVPHNVF